MASWEPAANFTAMDFPTRNLYRSAIEELARGSDRAEIEIAKRAVMAAEMAPRDGNSIDFERRSDPGYHLLTGGRRAFERAIGFRPLPRAWFGRSGRALGIRGYVGAGVIVAGALLTVPLLLLASTGLTGTWLATLGCIGVIPAIDLSVALVNQMVTRTFGATLLPALELSTRRAFAPPHAGCGSDSADDAGFDRGAHRAAGDPPPCQSGRRSAFRAAVRLGRCRQRTEGWR